MCDKVLVALAHSIALSVPQGTKPNKQILEKVPCPCFLNLLIDSLQAAETLREVYSQLPCYDKIVPVLLKEPIKDLPLKWAHESARCEKICSHFLAAATFSRASQFIPCSRTRPRGSQRFLTGERS